ncbi:MAG: hypothetical protein KG003_13720 [Bacteroidetes bacterium]|nr:hypothetical protein [Bacteroidota bacterium]
MTIKHEKKICFVISPIGDADTETRKRSDKVLKHIITPSVEQLGYDVVRADKISEPGIITTQIIQHIVDSPLVIADLTERNPNVFYELALRHAIRKPLVQMIRKGDSIPFDVAATRIIQFDIQDLDSVEQAKGEILSQVKSLEAGKGEVDNPISVSLDLKMLKESGNPEQRSLADVVEAITDLRGSIISIDKRINSPEGLISPEYLDKYFHRMRNLIGPDFALFSKEIRYEIKEVIERLRKFIEISKQTEKNSLELSNVSDRLERISLMFEEIYYRQTKYKF